ncbi:hypothetical protein TNCV_4976781 [Trichonephila clavipes]|nr:hypothetical protein TNCV_4976781 [Trichonephila clavipes]
MYARTTPTRHGLTGTFENIRCFIDRSCSHGYSCHKVHFRIEGRVVNCVSERSLFRQVLMHPSERLMVLLPPRRIYFPLKPKSNMFISVGWVVDEVDIWPLDIRITIPVHRTLFMSEMRKPHVPTLRDKVQRHLSLPAYAFLCNYGSSGCSLLPLQVCTRHSETPCICIHVGFWAGF